MLRQPEYGQIQPDQQQLSHPSGTRSDSWYPETATEQTGWGFSVVFTFALFYQDLLYISVITKKIMYEKKCSHHLFQSWTSHLAFYCEITASELLASLILWLTLKSNLQQFFHWLQSCPCMLALSCINVDYPSFLWRHPLLNEPCEHWDTTHRFLIACGGEKQKRLGRVEIVSWDGGNVPCLYELDRGFFHIVLQFSLTVGCWWLKSHMSNF